MKKIIIAILLLTNWLLLILCISIFIFGISYALYSSGNMQWGKALIDIIMTKFILLLLAFYFIYSIYKKAGPIWNAYILIKGALSYLLHHYKKSTQVFRSNELSKKNMSFLLNPFAGHFYSDLSDLKKRMLGEKGQKIENTIETTDWSEYMG